MLPRPLRQESLSKAYVRAIAAKAGLVCWESEYDFGIDLSLRAVFQLDEHLAVDRPQLDLQLKSTTRAGVTEKAVVYDLSVKNYNDLRTSKELDTQFLIVFVMPEDEILWLAQSDDELILRHCAYWLSLDSYPPTDATSTVRVTIPRGNVFSVAAVETMMRRLQERKKS